MSDSVLDASAFAHPNDDTLVDKFDEARDPIVTYCLYEIRNTRDMRGYAGVTSQRRWYTRALQHVLGQSRGDNKKLIARHFEECGDLEIYKQLVAKRLSFEDIISQFRYFEFEKEPVTYTHPFFANLAELALIKSLSARTLSDGTLLKFSRYNERFQTPHNDLKDAEDGSEQLRTAFIAVSKILTRGYFEPEPHEMRALEKHLTDIKNYVERPDHDPRDVLNKEFYYFLIEEILPVQARLRDEAHAHVQISHAQRKKASRLSADDLILIGDK